MNAVTWLLMNGATALRWLWHTVKTLFVESFHALDVVLGPPLSWLLAHLNPVCTAIGDFVFGVLDALPIWLGLVLISLLAGAAMLIVFRYTSNQDAIGRIKDDMKADLLAVKLFKDSLRVTFVSQFRLLRSAARLQWHLLAPMMVMLAPMSLGLSQMGVRYQWRPLRSGETTLIKMTVDENVDPSTVSLEPCAALIVEVGPISGKVNGKNELVWRVRGGVPGRYSLEFRVGAAMEQKELIVADDLARVSAERSGPVWTKQIFHPIERPFPKSSPVSSIEIFYGARDSMVYGADWWIVTFFVVSIASALVLKPLFKVRF